MTFPQIVQARRVVAAASVAVLVWCSSAKAQVLEQIPSNAAIVLKVNNLQGLSTKIAKLAKDFGVDELQPELKDPLGALMKDGKISKGINKAGDMAICGFDADGMNGKALVLVPVDDFQAFTSNFESGGPAEGGIMTLKQTDGPTIYAASRGKYAAVSPDKSLVEFKATGLKLSGAAGKDAQSKDVILFVNLPSFKDKLLAEIHKNRQQTIDEMTKELGADANAKPFVGVAKVVAGEVFDFADHFLSDTQSVIFSANINDQGISLGGMAEFVADSNFGKTVAQMKNTNKPLLAGLPDRKYFAFGGMAWDSKVMSKVMGDIIDPINAELTKSGENGMKIAKLLDSTKQMASNISRVTAGYPVAQGALGNESVIQQVAIVEGDAKAVHSAETSLYQAMNDLLTLLPKEAGQAKVDLKPESKTIDGVKFDSFSMNMAMDPNDPKAAQVQQMMGLIYGPNGMGGLMGNVNDKTFLMIQGGNDKLVSDSIASAKDGKDSFGAMKHVQLVSAQLPKERFFEQYIALDNIITAGVRYAQGFGLTVKLKLPADLPPLGIAGGTDGTAIRGELFIPSQTVQSLIAGGLQAYQQMQGGANNGL